MAPLLRRPETMLTGELITPLNTVGRLELIPRLLHAQTGPGLSRCISRPDLKVAEAVNAGRRSTQKLNSWFIVINVDIARLLTPGGHFQRFGLTLVRFILLTRTLYPGATTACPVSLLTEEAELF